MSRGLVWFRRDLRLDDNPAWASASIDHDEVVALFVADAQLLGRSPRRDALLVAHLRALDDELSERGGRLHVITGEPVTEVPRVAAGLGVDRVHLNVDVSSYSQRRDARVSDALRDVGIEVGQQYGNHVHPSGSIRTQSGTVYRVFSAFHRRWMSTPWSRWPEEDGVAVSDDAGSGWDALDEVAGAAGTDIGTAGASGATARLGEFLDRVDAYTDRRDDLAGQPTSLLSADLKFGTIAARRIVAACGDATGGAAEFVRQVAWRDHFASLLVETPTLEHRALRPEYDAIRWRDDAQDLLAWQEGRTGYPVVDAAMRQLAATGWVPGRARMVAASFLVKDLLIDWRLGERWFRRLLSDGDTASNVGNWQWVAGTGPDAAPWFRIFNPVTQSQRHDPDGAYIRQWVPELADLSSQRIHAPWEAGDEALAAAGVRLGENYPHPIVDHAIARERTLEIYGAAVRQ